MRILFLAARLPTELLRGYEVRAFHQIRVLSEQHRITLAAYTSGRPATAATRQLQEFCENVSVVRLHPVDMAVALLRRGLGGGLPLQVAMYTLPSMRRRLQELMCQEFDVVHVQTARLAHVFELARRAAKAAEPRRHTPCLIDLIDSLHLNMQRRSAVDRGATRRAARFEASRVARYEPALCDRFDRVLVTSNVDFQTLGAQANVVVNPNGVVLNPTPCTGWVRQANRILFSGNLGYFPNVDAAIWFAHEVLPRVQREVPEARFAIAGARPGRVVRALARLGSQVEVVGYVPDLMGEISRASVAVAPLRAGSGQPLKVLEAMACGTPVVASPHAIAGVAAEHERHLLVAQDAEGFAAMVVRLLRDTRLAERLALAARQLVAERYSWETSVAQLASVYAEVCAGGSR